MFPIRQSDAASVVLANDPQQDFMVNRYPWFSISSVQISGNLASIADEQVLYLTTIGRTTGLPREIEIWFVVCRERFYLLAETGEAAGWVKNIRRNPRVTLRIAERQIDAMARVLDRQADRKLWDEVAAIADRKYG